MVYWVHGKTKERLSVLINVVFELLQHGGGCFLFATRAS